MKISYCGYEISAKRERTLGGWDNLYYYIMRERDGWFIIDSFTTGEDSVASYIKWMKALVDEEVEKPPFERWEEYRQ